VRESVENTVCERENCFHDDQIKQALEILNASLVSFGANKWYGNYQTHELQNEVALILINIEDM